MTPTVRTNGQILQSVIRGSVVLFFLGDAGAGHDGVPRVVKPEDIQDKHNLVDNVSEDNFIDGNYGIIGQCWRLNLTVESTA